jgi:hypothetical protein
MDLPLMQLWVANLEADAKLMESLSIVFEVIFMLFIFVNELRGVIFDDTLLLAGVIKRFF